MPKPPKADPKGTDDRFFCMSRRQAPRRVCRPVGGEPWSARSQYAAWFRREVERGLAQIDARQTATHEAVGTRLARKFAEHGPYDKSADNGRRFTTSDLAGSGRFISDQWDVARNCRVQSGARRRGNFAGSVGSFVAMVRSKTVKCDHKLLKIALETGRWVQ